MHSGEEYVSDSGLEVTEHRIGCHELVKSSNTFRVTGGLSINGCVIRVTHNPRRVSNRPSGEMSKSVCCMEKLVRAECVCS